LNSRPVVFVLAGVNGAGKSSIGGHLLRHAGLDWYNPDRFAREFMATTGCEQPHANGLAWQEGMRRLDTALGTGTSFAFETTLGGNHVPARLHDATATHDVVMWFCGLDSVDRHLARVQARVAAGGHDIPEAKIRERWTRARANLIGLMPHLAWLRVFDNSTDAAPGAAVPDPLTVLEMQHGRLLWPTDAADWRHTPDWAKPLLEAALATPAAR
jgi:predicted ABC-type ATPase